MNRQCAHKSAIIRAFQRGIGICACLGALFAISTGELRQGARAQMTLDGTNCIVFADQPVGEMVRCVKRRGDQSTLKISLIGKPPNLVRQIELSIDGLAPFQTIEISAQPIVGRQDIGLLITDMNFDGYEDFAVMEFAAAGPNTPYVYFVFNKKTQLFEKNAELAAITSPVFDVQARQIISKWRDGAARNGRDTYIWQSGKPVLHQRTERRYTGTDCTEQRHARKDGKLQLAEIGKCGK